MSDPLGDLQDTFQQLKAMMEPAQALVMVRSFKPGVLDIYTVPEQDALEFLGQQLLKTSREAGG